MNTFSDSDNQLQKLEEKELLVNSLRRHHKGDAQLIADSISDLHQDEEIKAMLDQYHQLQQRIFDRWQALGYSAPAIQLGESTDIDALEGQAKIEPPAIPVENAVVEATAPETYSETPVEIPLDPNPTLEFDDAREEEVREEEVSPKGDYTSEENYGSEEPSDEEAIVINLDPVDTSPDLPPEINVIIPQRVQVDYPNGKVDQPYHYTIPVETLGISVGESDSIETGGFNKAGLILDQEDWSVKGLPEEQGQFELVIKVEFRDAEGRKKQMILEGTCNINPDPRSLWKEHEPPADAPYQKSHTDSFQLENEEALVIGASRRGRAHAHKGDFRDDDFHIDQVGNSGWYVLAVADGAGSAKFSREGSRLAVKETAAKLNELVDGEFTATIAEQLNALAANNDPQVAQNLRLQLYDSLVGAVFDGYKAILREADQQGAAQRDYATTLLLTVTRKFPQGWFIASYWVGDGCIGVYRERDSVQLLGTPDGGEFAGQTRFFTMQEIWKDAQTILNRLQIALVPDFTGLFLMTDGISDPKFQTDYNLQQVPKWDEFWTDLQNSVDFGHTGPGRDEELLEWLNFWSQGDHDDRTLVIMTPKDLNLS